MDDARREALVDLRRVESANQQVLERVLLVELERGGYSVTGEPCLVIAPDSRGGHVVNVSLRQVVGADHHLGWFSVTPHDVVLFGTIEVAITAKMREWIERNVMQCLVGVSAEPTLWTTEAVAELRTRHVEFRREYMGRPVEDDVGRIERWLAEIQMSLDRKTAELFRHHNVGWLDVSVRCSVQRSYDPRALSVQVKVWGRQRCGMEMRCLTELGTIRLLRVDQDKCADALGVRLLTALDHRIEGRRRDLPSAPLSTYQCIVEDLGPPQIQPPLPPGLEPWWRSGAPQEFVRAEAARGVSVGYRTERDERIASYAPRGEIVSVVPDGFVSPHQRRPLVRALVQALVRGTGDPLAERTELVDKIERHLVPSDAGPGISAPAPFRLADWLGAELVASLGPWATVLRDAPAEPEAGHWLLVGPVGEPSYQRVWSETWTGTEWLLGLWVPRGDGTRREVPIFPSDLVRAVVPEPGQAPSGFWDLLQTAMFTGAPAGEGET